MGCKISLVVEEPSALELSLLFDLAILWTWQTITFLENTLLKNIFDVRDRLVEMKLGRRWINVRT